MSELLNYKCPCCGGAIEFDSSLQKMKCPYCDTEYEMEILKGYDEDLKTDAPDEFNWETQPGSEWQDGEADGIAVYICNSCGGEIVGEETTAAMHCPFCSNPVVMLGKLAGDLRPDYVIPFKLDKKAAMEGLKKHLQGKRLIPKLFKDENRIKEIKAMYVPFWLFDADTDAKIRYKATRVRHWSDSRYDYREVSFYSVFRSGSIDFERVPVDGSQKMPDDLMESIEPYNFADAVDFQTAYLSGYLADRYDVKAEESIIRANERIKKSTEQAFEETVHGYTTLVPESSNVKIANGKAKYALLPVWILNTKWQDKDYIFAMNGQTGKFVGDLPVDKKAAKKWTAGLTALFAAITYALAWLIWFLK
ncbi:MAG: hypothetical protein IJZ90_04415 [Clostridia bacterium]|nr:hypothetical protein [Clostridia bacterium]